MPPDSRIHSLTNELNRLRNSHNQSDNQLHSLLLKITEIQLNLATQDRTLGKLDDAVNGNATPGLKLRVDRIERVASNLVKSVWLLTATAITAVIHVLFDRFK